MAVFLRTAAIFYLPVAALSFFFRRESTLPTSSFTLLIWPVEAIVSLSLIAHCIESLHGRPLAVRTAVRRGLRRLPVDFGMMVATSVVYIGVTSCMGDTDLGWTP